jgi:hypothetical protein
VERKLTDAPGELGFILRCKVCGHRIDMVGDRLPSVTMLEEGLAELMEAAI